MLEKYLTSNVVALDVENLNTPEEVIRYAGQLLVNANKVKEGYVDRLIETFHKLGPYIVMAPGIALPHTRPGDDVAEPCISFIRLKEPVKFNHNENDPVKLVFAIAGVDDYGHIELLKSLSILLCNEERLNGLYAAKSYNELEKILKYNLEG